MPSLVQSSPGLEQHAACCKMSWFSWHWMLHCCMEMTAYGVGSLAKVSVHRSGATQRWRVGHFAARGHLTQIKTEAKPGQSQSARKGMVLECQGFFLVSDSEIWPVFFVCLTKFPTQNTCLHCLHKCIWDTWRSLPKLLLRLEKRLRRWGSWDGWWDHTVDGSEVRRENYQY